MTPETKIKKLYARDAMDRGCLLVTVSNRYTAGLPDCIQVYKGNVTWIEFKAYGKKLRPLQASWIKKLIKHGAVCVLVIGEKGNKDYRTIELGYTTVEKYTSGTSHSRAKEKDATNVKFTSSPMPKKKRLPKIKLCEVK